MTTPPLDQLATEYERKKQETDDSAWTDGRRSHVEMFAGTFLVESERSAALALIASLDQRVKSLTEALESALGIIAANRLVLGEYMGAEWLSREEKRIRQSVSKTQEGG